MLKDTEIRIERVKNFMDPFVDVGSRGGLRQVVVNLRVDDHFTRSVVWLFLGAQVHRWLTTRAACRWLGIETHVCEVSLCLKPYAECLLKLSEAQRKRYILLRDSRSYRVPIIPLSILPSFRGAKVHAQTPTDEEAGGAASARAWASRGTGLNASHPFPSRSEATSFLGEGHDNGKLAEAVKSETLREEVSTVRFGRLTTSAHKHTPINT